MFYMRVCSSVGLERMATNYKVGGSNPSRLSVSYAKIYKYIIGKRGIRTLGSYCYDGFQNRCNRPLCHLPIYTYNSIIIDIMLKYYCISLFIFLFKGL